MSRQFQVQSKDEHCHRKATQIPFTKRLKTNHNSIEDNNDVTHWQHVRR